MLEQPTKAQRDELDTCIAVGSEVVSMEREQYRLQNKHDFDNANFTEDDQRTLNTLNTYLPGERKELQRRKDHILMRGQPHL